MPWKKGNIREFHKHTCKITFLPENILAFWQSGCLYSALDTTASQWLVRDPFHMFVKCLKMRPGKKTPCSHKALLSLVWKSVFCYQTFSPETYRSARLIISKATCGSSHSHHLPVEGPSLTDFPNQNKTIHKSAKKQTLTQGGFEYSFFPHQQGKNLIP